MDNKEPLAGYARQAHLLGLTIEPKQMQGFMMQIDVIGTRGFPGIQGGVERHCECLYGNMSEVSVRVFRRKPFLTPEAAAAKYPHIRFTDLPSTRIKGLEAVLHSLLATVISVFSAARVVHIHNIGPAIFSPLLRLTGKRVVLTYHSANYEHDKWNRIEKLILRLSEKIALATAHRIIFVNSIQRDKYPERIRRKSVCIANGITPMASCADTSFLQHLVLKPKKYLLTVGRITPEKGLDILIRAFRKLRTDTKLVIAGAPDQDSSYLHALRSEAGTNGRVVFTGFVQGDNLSQLYTHASAYVLASRTEGFPLVLLEAISFGLPLIVSDIDATRLLPLAQASYFEANNSEALSRKLTEFLTACHASDYVCHTVNVADYNWQNIASQVVEVYRSEKISH